jgi:hypothetical protein
MFGIRIRQHRGCLYSAAKRLSRWREKRLRIAVILPCVQLMRVRRSGNCMVLTLLTLCPIQSLCHRKEEQTRLAMAFVAIGFGDSLIGALGVDVVLVEPLPRCLPIRVSKHCVMAISKLQLRIALTLSSAPRISQLLAPSLCLRMLVTGQICYFRVSLTTTRTSVATLCL